MTTFITHLVPAPGRPRLAVKDCIDVAGTVTTDGCPAVAAGAAPAAADAACVARARAAGLQVVGKANLHELCHGGTGINEHYGTPVNPRDPDRIPGGSSSGSAVAVASGEADVALGTDTSGSVRIPAAACGVTGLKTTYGLIPRDGVLPLAPSLDSVGPIAADVAGLARAMTWLVPGFPATEPAPAVLRVRPARAVRPEIDAAVDRALRVAGYPLVDAPFPDWDLGGELADRISEAEAAREWSHLLDRPDLLGRRVRDRLAGALEVTSDELRNWRGEGSSLAARVKRLTRDGTVLALPTLDDEPPLLAEASDVTVGGFCGMASVAGLPALAMPIPAGGLIASLQLVGPAYGEATLIATAARIEAAIASTAAEAG